MAGALMPNLLANYHDSAAKRGSPVVAMCMPGGPDDRI
jgi:hypothetical protein